MKQQNNQKKIWFIDGRTRANGLLYDSVQINSSTYLEMIRYARGFQAKFPKNLLRFCRTTISKLLCSDFPDLPPWECMCLVDGMWSALNTHHLTHHVRCLRYTFVCCCCFDWAFRWRMKNRLCSIHIEIKQQQNEYKKKTMHYIKI